MGQMAPPGAGSPELKFDAVYINCLRSKRYEPETGAFAGRSILPGFAGHRPILGT